MGINTTMEEQQSIEKQVPAKWRNRGQKYLGIKFAKDLHLMIQDNIGVMIEIIDKQFQNWMRLPLTWLG